MDTRARYLHTVARTPILTDNIRTVLLNMVNSLSEDQLVRIADRVVDAELKTAQALDIYRAQNATA